MPTSPATPAPPKLRSASQAAARLGIDMAALRELAETGALLPVGFFDQALIFYEDEVEALAANLPAMLACGGLLPKNPGQRFRLRSCEECSRIYQPVGPNHRYCSDDCKAARRERRREAGE